MSEDKLFTKEDMEKVGRLNPFLRDVCGVPLRDSFRISMLIVENWDGIKSRLEGNEING